MRLTIIFPGAPENTSPLRMERPDTGQRAPISADLTSGSYIRSENHRIRVLFNFVYLVLCVLFLHVNALDLPNPDLERAPTKGRHRLPYIATLNLLIEMPPTLSLPEGPSLNHACAN